jgi:Nucleotidyl transferase AbiEii toxin, Type IV TA system
LDEIINDQLRETMEALTFWKTITMDQSNLLENLISLLNEQEIRFCVIGGQAVNAYVEPLVSLDLDLVVAVHQLEQVEELLQRHFVLKRFPHSLNVSSAGSDLRVQIQTDERYARFVERAARREVLGLELPVASVEDVLQGKIWAVQDAGRRGSKRQKDLADIARLLEKYPELRRQVPQEVRARLVDDTTED